MVYYNQRREPTASIPYITRTATGGIADEKKFVYYTGCGICSVCMIVENLTDHKFSVEEGVQMSYDTGANQWAGTSLKRLGPAVAERFGLDFCVTDDLGEVLEHLKRGGMAAALVFVQKDTGIGLFTDSGHYITLVSFDGEDVCILDPSYTEEKYEKEGRKGKVKIAYPFLYAAPEVLHRETTSPKEKPSPKYYLFSRKKP